MGGVRILVREKQVEAVLGVGQGTRYVEAERAQSRGADRDHQGRNGALAGRKVAQPLVDDVGSWKQATIRCHISKPYGMVITAVLTLVGRGVAWHCTEGARQWTEFLLQVIDVGSWASAWSDSWSCSWPSEQWPRWL